MLLTSIGGDGFTVDKVALFGNHIANRNVIFAVNGELARDRVFVNCNRKLQVRRNPVKKEVHDSPDATVLQPVDRFATLLQPPQRQCNFRELFVSPGPLGLDIQSIDCGTGGCMIEKSFGCASLANILGLMM